MNDFLNSVKADLTDRRLLPLVAVVGAVLIGALAYLVVGGGSGSSTPVAAVPSGPTPPPAGLAISQSKPETANAEMTGGVAVQHHGHARNPFTPLPQPKTATTASASTTSAASSGSSGSAGSGAGSSTPQPSAPAPSKPEPKPSAPPKPKTTYHVAIQFGVLPAGTTPQAAQLTAYENLKLLSPLPATGTPLIVFRGVTAGGQAATFTLVGEAILHGQGACLPSATQCEAVDLKAGQSEQLEYLPLGGATVTYELRVVSIAAAKASTASVKHGESGAGKALLAREGLLNLPLLRESSQPGVLVWASHHASAARAHDAKHHRRGR